MAPVRPARQPQPQPALPTDEERAVLEQARALQRAAAEGRVQALLRGKHLCLLCEDSSRAEAVLFHQAASGLGAKVVPIGISLSERSELQEVEHTARVLGRLYDAVECQGLHRRVVQQMARVAGIAVYDGLASKDPRTARIAALLGGGLAPQDSRRFALQALLLHTIV